MMKEAVRALETGALAEVGVVAFTVAFVLVVVYAFTLSRGQRERAKALPLSDPDEVFDEVFDETAGPSDTSTELRAR